MNFTEYQEATKRTLSNLGSEAMDLAHMVLGMCSEENEILEAQIKGDDVNIGEECADKMWYVSNYCNIRGYVLYDLIKTRDQWEDDIAIQCDTEIYALSKLQDFVKKNLVYNKPINREEEVKYLRMYLDQVCTLIEAYNFEADVLLENNINKLKVRFPEKFTEELANNRDLTEERKQLEK